MLNTYSRLLLSHAVRPFRNGAGTHPVSRANRPVSLPRQLKSSRFTTLPNNSKQLYRCRPILAIRTFNSGALSWDSFRKDSALLSEKIAKLVTGSNGHLERGMADMLAKELINLDQRNPGRQSTIFSTHMFEHDSRTRAISKAADLGDRDSEVDHYEVLLVLAFEAGDTKLCMELFSEIVQKDVDITSLMVNLLMMSHLRQLEPNRALAIFRKADSIKTVKSENKEDSITSPVDALTLCYAVDMFRSLGDVHNMSKTYGRLSKLAASQEVRVEVLRQALMDYITGLVALGYPSLAVQVYEDIGRTADVNLIQVSSVLTAMLEAYSHLNKHYEVVQLFDKMAAASVGLSYQMILRVIVSRLALQQTSKARSMYKTLEEQVMSGGGVVTGVGPTSRLSHTFEDLAKMALSKDGFPAARPTCEDKSILEILKENPSVQNYEQAINQFALGGDLKLAEELLNDWMNKAASNSTGPIASSSSSIRPPTSSMVSALVNGSIRLNNGHFLDLIETHKIKPTTSLTRSIVQFHLKRQDPTMAASVLLKTLTNKSSTIGSAVLTSILTSFNLGHASALPAGANFYHQIVATIPDELTIEFFNAALKLFTKMMDGDSITGILNLIKSRSLVPNVTTYTCLMQIYLKKPDYKMAVTTYMQILEQGLVPDSAAVLALATALGESKALAHAKSVRFLQEQLDYCPMDPTPTALEVLQKACNLAENPSAFAILLDTLKQKFNIQLTTEQYMAWLSSLLEFDDIPAAIDLAISVSGLARRKPDILTRAFCCRLALHISEQVGTDFPMDSLDRWIVDPSAGSLTLEPGELLKFQADLKTWASFYPSRQPF